MLEVIQGRVPRRSIEAGLEMNPAERAPPEDLADSERRYEAIKLTAIDKKPLPFEEWMSRQSDEFLLTTGGALLALHFDAAYGGPAVVERFFDNGLRHLITNDIATGANRLHRDQCSDMQTIICDRSRLRNRLVEHLGPDWPPVYSKCSREDAVAQLQKQANLAATSGMKQLAKQYEELLNALPESKPYP